MHRTRREILEILKRRGTVCLQDLARELGLVPVTVRSHLAILQREGLVTAREVRGKVGRPYFTYSLTSAACDLFPQDHGSFVNRLLEGVRETQGPEKVEQLFDELAQDWAEERRLRLEGRSLDEKVVEVAAIRTEEGALAECEKVEGGYLVRQYNCPVPEVARKHPEMCRAELEYVSRLFGVETRRIEWLGKGDRACTYFVHGAA